MKSIGELYDKLVVMPVHDFPAYYMLVKRVLREAAEDFPHLSSYDWGDKKYREWYDRWFSQLVSDDV